MFVSRGLRGQVEALLADGLTVAEIARRLGVAGPTVEYHVERIRNQNGRPLATPRSPAPRVRSQVGTRHRVAALLEAGLTRAEIARELGVSKGTVSYHARRLGKPVDSRCARRYDWEAIQKYYDLGHSVRECVAQFGFSSETWHQAVLRGAIRARPTKMSADEFFAEGVHRGRTYLKLRLLAEGFKEPRCAICEIREWRGKPMSLALHHINGDRDDNRVENLELLCPNCHSQTDNFSGRNGHRRPT